MLKMLKPAAVFCAFAFSSLHAADLPDPDGKPADLSKPVKVFILLGQSNMVGAGKVQGDKEGALEYAVKTEKLYPFLVDDEGAWTERQDVRYVRYMSGKKLANEWMKVGGRKIGPEFGIGHQLGNALDEPVMILKSCIGNRSLGWDLLPPGSEGYEFEEKDKHVYYLDKRTGQVVRQLDADRVDYRRGCAPLSGNNDYLVYPYGRLNLRGAPAVYEMQDTVVVRRANGAPWWTLRVGDLFGEVTKRGVGAAGIDGHRDAGLHRCRRRGSLPE